MPATSESRIRTLGLRTDLAIEGGRAIVSEHERFIAVRTPSNPGYHFGNFLIFDDAPSAGDEERWPQLFGEVFASDAGVRHAAFAWSGAGGLQYIEGFIDRGYAVEDRAVLTAARVHEFTVPQGLYVRHFRCDNDWQAQFELSMATRDEVHESESYARFKAAQIAYHRKISEDFGAWLGMFDGAQLVGSCGIYSIGDGIARYQDVGVLPAYRNRGIARCLVGAAGRFAIERFGVTQLVIVANEGGFARTIYERCGFTFYERERALWIAAR
jgi:GNAT superfamily N-acetyltransferase